LRTKVTGNAAAIAETVVTESHEQHVTTPGSMLGTVAYMSPEQGRAKELDAAQTCFSFGAVLYEMATGKLPFEGATAGEICGAILHQSVRPVSQLDPEVPPQLETIHKALEKDRKLRYQHASEMRADLSRVLRGSSSEGGTLTDSGRHLGDRISRHKVTEDINGCRGSWSFPYRRNSRPHHLRGSQGLHRAPKVGF
jgi:serine/threonine protein kinase